MSCFELYSSCPGRAECAECAAYDRLVVEPFAAEEPSISRDLSDRLRAIGSRPPRRKDDVDDAAQWFESVAADARRPRPMPDALRRSLRAIPSTAPAVTRRRPPSWLADGRWGVAACALLTAALTLAAGDVSARFQTTTDAVERQVDAVVSQADSSWSPAEWITDSLVHPIGALGRAGLDEVRDGRRAAVDWLDREIDEVVSDARETGQTTWTWMATSADTIGDQLGLWVDQLQTSIGRLIDSDSASNSDPTDTNDTGAVPPTSPDEQGSLP